MVAKSGAEPPRNKAATGRRTPKRLADAPQNTLFFSCRVASYRADLYNAPNLGAPFIWQERGAKSKKRPKTQ
jgi:hypothetical protein